MLANTAFVELACIRRARGAGDGPFRFHTQGDWRKPLLVRLNRRDYRSHCRGLPGYMALTACSYRQAGRRAHQITSNF